MPQPRPDRHSFRAAAAIAGCILAFTTAGCATGPGPDRRPSSPYKGDAVWNISSIPAPHGGAERRRG